MIKNLLVLFVVLAAGFAQAKGQSIARVNSYPDYTRGNMNGMYVDCSQKLLIKQMGLERNNCQITAIQTCTPDRTSSIDEQIVTFVGAIYYTCAR